VSPAPGGQWTASIITEPMDENEATRKWSDPLPKIEEDRSETIEFSRRISACDARADWQQVSARALALALDLLHKWARLGSADRCVSPSVCYSYTFTAGLVVRDGHLP